MLKVFYSHGALDAVSVFKHQSGSFEHMNQEKHQTFCVSVCMPAGPHVFGCPVSYYCVSYSKLHAAFLLSELFVRIRPSTFLDGIGTKKKPERQLSPGSYVFGQRHLREAEKRDRCWEWRMRGKWGGRGETECWSEKVKSLLFFCPAPVARPLLPPLSSQSCSPGERAEQKCTKALCERVSCRRASVQTYMYFVCSFACQ